MRTLIVDDEPLARSRLKRLLADYPNIECVGEASGADEALSIVEQLNPDLVMLDIEMPGEDGLSIAERLNQRKVPPAIILVTAHPEHALDAYRVGPSDYLLKPVDPKRLKLALERLMIHPPSRIEKNDEVNPWISYQVGNSQRRIKFEKILYFVAEDKVVKMVFDDGEAIVEQSLKQLEKEFSMALIRVHRSYLVNTSRLESLMNTSEGIVLKLNHDDTRLPVSRRHSKQLKAYFNNRLSSRFDR